MGDALAWVLLLLPLLLQNPGSQGLSCSVSSRPVNWTSQFSETCMNFSGQNLSLPENQPLQASGLELLDLSGNYLKRLPWSFFKQLNRLKFLNVTNNPLEYLDSELAAHCNLTLQADCSCGLACWYETRQNKCFDHLECLNTTDRTWRNVSTLYCLCERGGLSKGVIGALVTSGSLVLVLAIAGPVLVWRLRGRRTSDNPVQGKTWTPQDGPQTGLNQQPRYSNRGFKPKLPAATLPSPSSPDYENMFQGQPTNDGYQPWAEHRSPTSEDGEVYMNYEGGDQDSQPVYCNLQTLGQAPLGQTPLDQTSLDEEEYVIPGR